MAQPSEVNIPPGNVARVRIIDTTSKITTLETHHVMRPPMPGMYVMPDIPAWSFLVESSTGRKALFDLGIPPNFKDFSPWVLSFLSLDGWGWQISSKKHVADILKENDVNPVTISDIVWSHWHWDHIGDPSTFPPSTRLVVGPGVTEKFFPGYPSNTESPIRENDYSGREVVEVTFDDPSITLQIGQFRAIDFFGDGSFYLLDTPGHAIGHIGALARTTPDTFIMMGGDLCHHGGALRPSAFTPLPPQVELKSYHNIHAGFCPASRLEKLQQGRGRQPNEPFFEPAFGEDIPLAIATIGKTQELDASLNIFFMHAHDTSIKGVVDMFPLDVNNWKKEGWREKAFWRFLEDFAAVPES